MAVRRKTLGGSSGLSSLLNATYDGRDNTTDNTEGNVLNAMSYNFTKLGSYIVALAVTEFDIAIPTVLDDCALSMSNATVTHLYTTNNLEGDRFEVFHAYFYVSVTSTGSRTLTFTMPSDFLGTATAAASVWKLNREPTFVGSDEDNTTSEFAPANITLSAQPSSAVGDTILAIYCNKGDDADHYRNGAADIVVTSANVTVSCVTNAANTNLTFTNITERQDFQPKLTTANTTRCAGFSAISLR